MRGEKDACHMTEAAGGCAAAAALLHLLTSSRPFACFATNDKVQRHAAIVVGHGVQKSEEA